MQNELVELLLRRRSVRDYRPDPLTDDQINMILEAGCNAPSAHDSRPWRFAAIRTQKGKQRLLDALSGAFARDLIAAGFSEEERQARLARSCGIFSQAPFLVVAFCRVAQPKNPLAKSIETERTLATQSVALAAGQMLLSAEAQNLGGCWFAAPLFCEEEVCKACGLDRSHWVPQCLLTFGYAAKPPKAKKAPTLLESVIEL